VFADGTREACAGRTFLMDDDGRVRCASAGRPFWALLSRTATQLLVAQLDGATERLLVPDGPCPLTVSHTRDWSRAP
jgi:hypothetical protein